VGPRTGLDDVERKKPCPYRDSNFDPSVIQPIAQSVYRLRYLGSSLPHMLNISMILKTFKFYF
jgi:hypothetical protein